MKIIEALKELPLLEKRIVKNTELIQQYSSGVDNGANTFQFGDSTAQVKEVTSLLQSTQDLIQRRAWIRRNLAYTNTGVKVTIGSFTRTITEWIEYRQHGIDSSIKAYNALNNNAAQNQLRTMNVDLAKGVRTVTFFDEKTKNDAINELMSVKSGIDSQLEIVNATTDLLEAA